MKTIVIIGSGIVGVSTAIWLQRDGHKVILIDKEGPAAGASYGNGGVLASCSVVPVTTPGLISKAPKMLFDPNQPLFLKWAYLPKLAPWLIKYLGHANKADAAKTAQAMAPIVSDSLTDHLSIAEGTGAEKWILPCDYLYVYDSRTHFEKDAFGWSLRAANGFCWEEFGPEAFASYDPSFSKSLKFAVRMKNHGRIIDPGEYVRSLAQHVVSQGGLSIKGTFEDFVIVDQTVTGVRVDGQTLNCDAAVLATGVWSKPLSKKLGLNVPLESERGYHLELWDPNFMPRAPVMVASGKFVATPMDGRLRVAGVVEFGGLKAGPSPQAFDLLRKSIKKALPTLCWSRETQWMGHRPAPADSIPIIGSLETHKGAFLGFGHHHVGLTGGPKTGRLLAQLISGQRPNIDMRVYAPARFGNIS